MKILYTSAIIPDYYEDRKIEYLESINILIKYINIDDIFNIECYLSDNSYLDKIFKNIYYSNTNSELNNKGVKEAMALKKFCNKIDFNNDEIIVKHTGRYKFIDNLFLENIKKNKEHDVFIRSGVNYQYFTGTFAMKFKYLKDFLNSLDLTDMENKMINIEKKLYDYINDEKLKKIVYDNINIYSKINNNDEYIW